MQSNSIQKFSDVYILVSTCKLGLKEPFCVRTISSILLKLFVTMMYIILSIKHSCKMRIIMNLSYPDESTSVNVGLNKQSYMGNEINLTYLGVDHLVRLNQKKGKGVLLFKRDLKKFYRQIFMDPASIHLLGFTFNASIYFDVVLSMGLAIACYIAQRITCALTYIYKKLGHEGVNYLDDLGSAEVKDKAWRAYEVLGLLINRLGIWESESKASSPAEVMIFLGVLCNTREGTLSITKERLLEMRKLVISWLQKDEATLREVQSLVGKLNFVCYTIRSGRVFILRILEFLHQYKGRSVKLQIPGKMKLDIKWWEKFLTKFNGVSMFPENKWFAPDTLICTDSCLTGCGGWSQGDYFHSKFPTKILNNSQLTINELDCLAVVIQGGHIPADIKFPVFSLCYELFPCVFFHKIN